MGQIHDWFHARRRGRDSSTAGIDLEAADEIDTSTWPTAIEFTPQQPVTDEFLKTVRTTDEHLDLKVGKGKKAQRYKVHKALLCRYSDYFQRACNPTGERFRETVQGVFDLPEDHPAGFRLLVEWLYTNDKQPDPYDAHVPQRSSPWGLFAVEACITGDKFMAESFSRFALHQIVQHAQLLDLYDMEVIYDDTLPENPLRLFAAQWLRWRCFWQPHLWESSRSLDLRQDRRRREPRNPDQAAPRDPRGFDCDHWYSECGRHSHQCGHHTLDTLPNPTGFDNKLQTRAEFNHTWKKRERHDRQTQLRSILPAVLIAYSSTFILVAVKAVMDVMGVTGATGATSATSAMGAMGATGAIALSAVIAFRAIDGAQPTHSSFVADVIAGQVSHFVVLLHAVVRMDMTSRVGLVVDIRPRLRR